MRLKGNQFHLSLVGKASGVRSGSDKDTVARFNDFFSPSQAESRTDSIGATEGSKSTYTMAGHSSLWYLEFDRREMY